MRDARVRARVHAYGTHVRDSYPLTLQPYAAFNNELGRQLPTRKQTLKLTHKTHNKTKQTQISNSPGCIMRAGPDHLSTTLQPRVSQSINLSQSVSLGGLASWLLPPPPPPPPPPSPPTPVRGRIDHQQSTTVVERSGLPLLYSGI